MLLSDFLVFIPACFALNMSPGPNNIMALNNAKSYSLTHSCVAGLGRLMAFTLMLLLVASGLAAVLYASSMVFSMLKVVGVLYLIYIAVQIWRSDLLLSAASVTQTSVMQSAKQEFTLAIGNPKAILIFTAFLPQFINPLGDITEQLYTLGILFLLLEFIAITLYSLIGVYLRQQLSRPLFNRLFNRLCASLLIAAALSLLFSGRDKELA
ncbi:MAG: LysE family translocator [Pseudomonadales bacterium]|nr:LysE family translocator [Pseudomonadales bacterium]NRA18818.1 LysE family translocator [Oceanospirillaceae bacterium]